MSQNGYVYILDTGDAIKIGKSINPKTRMASVENETGKKMLGYFASPDCSNYSNIEKARLIAILTPHSDA